MPRYQPARIREIRLHRRKKTATCSTYRAHGKVKPRKVSDISPLSRIDAEPRRMFGAVSPTAVTDDDPAATDAERRAVAAAAVTAPADTINPAAVAAVAEVGIDITGQTRKSSPPTPRPSWSPWAAATPALLPRNLLPRLETRRPRGQGIDAVRPIRDQIEAHIRDLLTELRTRSPMTPAVAPHARINHRDIRPGHRPTFDAQRTGNRERRSADSRTWPQRPTERVPERTVLPQPVPSCTG